MNILNKIHKRRSQGEKSILRVLNTYDLMHSVPLQKSLYSIYVLFNQNFIMRPSRSRKTPLKYQNIAEEG